MAIYMEVAVNRYTSMEVSTSFHESTWNFALSMEVEPCIFPSNAAHTIIFRGSLHELYISLDTSTYYVDEYHKLSAVSTGFP